MSSGRDHPAVYQGHHAPEQRPDSSAHRRPYDKPARGALGRSLLRSVEHLEQIHPQAIGNGLEGLHVRPGFSQLPQGDGLPGHI